LQVIEVFGAPGVGKSALFNDMWAPSVPWDGKPAPEAWQTFLAHVERIEVNIGADHWRRMFAKAVRKVATLSRIEGHGVYAGVGLAMRGLDLAWRGPTLDDVAEYCRQMPAPAGAISLYADQETIRRRNIERGKLKPSRELSKLAHLNDEPRALVTAILRGRGVPVLELDTREPIAGNVERIRAFVGMPAAAVDA
jgi:hypothetical protein